jgi:CDGSH-type Zn-finger protein
MRDETRIKVSANGPYLVTGNAPIAEQTIVVDEAGESFEWAEGEPLHAHPHYALCRCGSSHSKPYCDGTHADIGFDGTETAILEPYEAQADHIDGPVIGLRDAVALCADARFCHRRRIWSLTRTAESAGDVETVHRDACLCPSGRYTAVDMATGELAEPVLPPSIGLIQDPAKGASGPLWVRGGIPVESAGGELYETRNRVTLCRCGASKNKPFCDGSHLETGFHDNE